MWCVNTSWKLLQPISLDLLISVTYCTFMCNKSECQKCLWTLRYNNKRLNGSGSVFYTLVFYVIQFYYLICNWSDLLYFLRYYWHTLKCCFSIYISFTFSVLLLLVSIKKTKILDSSQDSRALYNSNALYDYRRLYGIWQQKMYDSDMSLAMEAYNWMLE